ncbi:hypothetical protein CYMTET_24535 [Cymbomonas tetramitiformis]|uniref:Uncharacterized protein n=1 Tax=Cymbomonas tetramitiformis TaxID=36881 RepID=A0AAE0FVW0_9CHLO|nr:hypothetical protein CYMTET_24535 [Cymbomonas tetramitiformis]
MVHEAAKLCPQLTLLKEIHPFGKLPMKALEANAFPAMVYALPELAAEECELDELPAGKEATQKHWRAFVHLLQARVGEFQHFVKSKPLQRLQQEDEGRIKWKDGDLTVVPKTKKCKDMDEWERGFFRIIQEAPAGAGEVPVVVPGPAVEMDMAPVVETEVEGEATLVERARGEREMEVLTGGHDRVPLRWEVERVAPLPVTQTSPDTWRSPEEPWRDWHDVDFLVRIELDKDEFTTVKEAYGMLRPRYWMLKVDMETAYQSKGIASIPGEAATAALVPEKTRVPV